MRLYLQVTRNNKLIPFNYQSYLTGAIHKWLGRNEHHGALSLYSFSWFENATLKNNSGIMLNDNSFFFISAFEENLIKQIINGILKDPSLCFGSEVAEIQISNTPDFSSKEMFFTGSPVFIKRRFDNKEKHITYDDTQCNDYLTETLQKKLKAAYLPFENIKVSFDTSYSLRKTKVIKYKEISNRVNICPVIIEGSPEQIAFAWNVGIGNSTGIGFGAIK
ncbi:MULTISPECIES: CRISPR-associated endoribonuclease Cas6 [Niastella]|uniref:CRISPR-associated endoribonuclease Cas6 n=1 Tax=Niastella soli TaxID=2821487 RepID=A0ABS3YYM8_9BACT|nr:CRISPR-associated endoribonuclease Cas6 [Niastella soli]MBO9202525.1 CRISPR-associated endoribonuclease Cas6 [Niastella soli]